jgi:hypothetical protein
MYTEEELRSMYASEMGVAIRNRYGTRVALDWYDYWPPLCALRMLEDTIGTIQIV